MLIRDIYPDLCYIQSAPLLSPFYHQRQMYTNRANTTDSIDSFNTRPTRPRTGQSTTRPWTAQSRPPTGRPTTAASTRHEASYVVALLEGRGVSREVGMAALDRDTGMCILVQVRSFHDISPNSYTNPGLYATVVSYDNRLRIARRMLKLSTNFTCIHPFWSLCQILFSLHTTLRLLIPLEV